MPDRQNEVTTKTPIVLKDGDPYPFYMVIRSCDFDRELVELQIASEPSFTLVADQLIEAIQNAKRGNDKIGFTPDE